MENSLKLSYKRKLIRDMGRDKYLYMLLIPGLIWFIIFKYLPMFGLVIAFKDFSFSKGVFGSDWVGLKNFKYIFFSHPDFFNILRNTILISLYKLIFGFPMPIILALMLNEVRNLKFKRMLQTSVYFPHFVSWVIFGGIIIQFLSPSYGIVNELLKLTGREPIFFMSEEKYFRSIVVLSDIWKDAGWGTIIYLAAITGIDQELYEAATIDGANKWQKTIRITLPCISETIVVLLLLNTGKILNVGFDQIFVLYNPTTYSVGDVISTYIYRIGIGNGRFSLTTAIGLFQSVVGLILIVLTNNFSKKISGKSIW